LQTTLQEEAMVKEIIRLKLDELQEEVEQKISDRMKHGRGPEPPSLAELVKASIGNQCLVQIFNPNFLWTL